MAPSFFSSSLLLSLSSLPLFFLLSLSLWEVTVKDFIPELSYTQVEYERQSKHDGQRVIYGMWSVEE